MDSSSFRSNLWEGTADVYARYGEGKEQSRDILAVIQARIAAEERYAKELHGAVAKGASTQVVDSGSLGSNWSAVRETHTALAEIHSAFAKKLQTEIAKPLTDDLKERSTQKNECADEDKALHSQLSKAKAACESALQRYHQASEAAEAAQKQFHFAQQDASMPPKKLKSLEEQDTKLTGAADQAHEKYKSSLTELNAVQKQFENGMLALLAKLQTLDEGRTKFVTQLLQLYADATQQMHKQESEVGLRVAENVRKIDNAADLQVWIKAHDTGLAPDELVQYEGYTSQYSNSGPDEVPNPSKVKGVFGKRGASLRKTGTASSDNLTGSQGGAAAGDGKKMERQKSKTNMLGKSSKGNDVKAPASPVTETKKVNIVEGDKGKSPPPSNTKIGVSGPATKTAAPTTAAAGSPATIAAGPKATTATAAAAAAAAAAAKPAKTGRRAKALFEFIASDDTELSFNVGDVITVIRVDDSGWWDAQKDAGQGLVPGNYLEFIEDEQPAAAAASPAATPAATPGPQLDEPEEDRKASPRKSVDSTHSTTAAARSPSIDSTPSVVVAQVTKTADVKKSPRSVEPEPPVAAAAEDDSQQEEEEGDPIGVVIALYDFAGGAEDELPLKVGDRVEIYAEVEGWYTGCNAEGRYGLFPANFAKRVDE